MQERRENSDDSLLQLQEWKANEQNTSKVHVCTMFPSKELHKW